MKTMSRPLLTLTALALAVGPLSTSHAMLDKTRFVAHLGVAYYAFHHWVMTPYKSGEFAKTNPHHVASMVKGGLALAFAAHEVSVAEKVAHHSRDPLLQKLDSQLIALQSSFTNVGSKMKNGQATAADLDGLDSAATSLSQTSAAGGQTIKDIAAPVPGL